MGAPQPGARPAPGPHVVLGRRRGRVLQEGAQQRLAHDARVSTLQPVIPPAQHLLQEADLRAGLGEVRILVRPRADEALLRALQVLQQAEDPYAIPFLRQAILLKPRLEYLSYDDYGAYYKKCFWALSAIGTPEALGVIEDFARSPHSVVREQAAYRLTRIGGKAR